MAKGSGSSRASSSGNPKGLAIGNSIGIWKRGEDSLSSMRLTAKGKEAKEIYDALQTSVEQAVRSKVGYIRNGGGTSGPINDKEYVLIFREGTTKAQIQNYLKEMKAGASLYAKMQDAYKNGTEDEYNKARDKYDKWYNKTKK